jgi:hypothetical protein
VNLILFCWFEPELTGRNCDGHPKSQYWTCNCVTLIMRLGQGAEKSPLRSPTPRPTTFTIVASTTHAMPGAAQNRTRGHCQQRNPPFAGGVT